MLLLINPTLDIQDLILSIIADAHDCGIRFLLSFSLSLFIQPLLLFLVLPDSSLLFHFLLLEFLSLDLLDLFLSLLPLCFLGKPFLLLLLLLLFSSLLSPAIDLIDFGLSLLCFQIILLLLFPDVFFLNTLRDLILTLLSYSIFFLLFLKFAVLFVTLGLYFHLSYYTSLVVFSGLFKLYFLISFLSSFLNLFQFFSLSLLQDINFVFFSFDGFFPLL